ncbi:MAG: bifunctional N-acetylglucosamine-1-phosphate uridyltransferase/glucosamine-1-phosphate acetyltransferase [Planctomycetes bacterium]|nr:bifunctional N-acetylglucosamine-1-phosphate uridyltransferase/glucosamine-1-phosphate acetyltransferase [Planctomycetota bacterium]
MATALTVVILAAGMGKRMKSAAPKVLHPLAGRPMIAWVVDQALALGPERVIVVVGHGAADVEKALAHAPQRERITFVRQEPQQGTGHALQCCLPALGKDPGVVVVLYGDMPLLRVESLGALLETQADAAAGGAAILTALPDNARGFGRIVRFEDGSVERIVEDRDATPAEKLIAEVNLGVYAFDGRELVAALPRLESKNAQGEYYLTDVIAMLVRAKKPVAAVELEDIEETIGVNTLADLAEARWVLQMRILEEHLENGVFIEDPATTYIDHGVTIGVGTKILPCTVIRAGCTIGKGCEVGPFTQLRAGTVLADGAEVGNFTECKNTRVGAHAKAKHLSYLGDAEIGERTNIGAGTIFANYDGVAKHKTKIGDNVFIGSGTVVVAPNTIPSGVTTGAGAVLTKNSAVQSDETWVGIPAKPLKKKGH